MKLFLQKYTDFLELDCWLLHQHLIVADRSTYLLAEIKSACAPPFLIAIVYPSPNAANLAGFEADFDRLSINYGFSIVLGDFNANQLADTGVARNVREFYTSRDLLIVLFTATCHTQSADTLLDLCFLSDRSSSLLRIISGSVHYLSRSHHG